MCLVFNIILIAQYCTKTPVQYKIAMLFELIYHRVSLKKHMSARKHNKASYYSLLERKISNLKIDTKLVQIG